MNKSELKQLIHEVVNEISSPKLMLGGIPIAFSISTGAGNEVTIHFYHGAPPKRIPFKAGSATLYRPSGTTNKGGNFYEEEARAVATDIKKKLGVKNVKWVEQQEFRMDYEKNKEYGPTGKKIYWLTIEYPEANSLLWNLLAKKIQSP